MDVAIGASVVPFGCWQSAAAIYDGEFARAYLNGTLDARESRNPYPYREGLFNAGENGADFTVGAVAKPEKVSMDFQEHGHLIANLYHGLLGGLAVFDRALTDPEIQSIAS